MMRHSPALPVQHESQQPVPATQSNRLMTRSLNPTVFRCKKAFCRSVLPQLAVPH